MNELLPLITNLSTQKKEYIVFAGAGLSKDAGIKSGWDILIETLIPIYLDEKKLQKLPIDYYSKIENWYVTHKELRNKGYSEILELVYQGEIERREYIKKFFQNVAPGDAHHQLAQLVKNHLIRFIFTTNFDDLIEKSLDEYNIDYDVIFSDDVLDSSKSWDKVEGCRIYKLHGDYKSGKVRNTIPEIENLEQKISEDFSYILDRHGVIVIGYAGRDIGVMNHFLNRKPHSYPFYWQYVEHPPKGSDFKYYYDFIDKYENTYKRKVQFIQNPSASDFLLNINNGIENLERALIVSTNKSERFRNYIINQSEKKIRALTLDNLTKFSSLLQNFNTKETQDNSINYQYENVQEFFGEINYIFEYLNVLNEFKQHDEAEFFLLNLLKPFLQEDWHYLKEFIQRSTPYYIILNACSIFIRHNQFNIFAQLYNLKLKIGSREYTNFISKVSYAGNMAWDVIGKDRYQKNYHLPRYSIIRDHLISNTITSKEFDSTDAYITFDLIFKNLDVKWLCGSSMYYETFFESFQQYFEDKITKDIYEEFVNKMVAKYNNYNMDMFEGIDEVRRHLQYKFSDKKI